ncbi:cobalt ECF transporter T component CbiQ [Desulfospira joergensenii]|uniref:cobalt ECF transporter T component CbiQ n=1 Tax=Desulfospira joergensenii TaxID=53329 RepID=UPI0003B6A139|nr:cobalt ECF transporter T component CbiQ [Desulfospira joergensenii]
MIEEVFAAGDSPVHSIDPRSRVAVATLLSFVIALCENFSTLWAGLVLSLVLVFAARLNPREVIKRVLVIWGFLLFLWILLPLTYEGDVIYRIGKLGLTKQGFLLCAKISLKSNAIVLTFIALIATMDFSTLGYTLNFFKMPKNLVHLLLLTYRYIFVIENEYRRLIRAAKIRSFQPKTNLHTYQTYAYLVGMLFVRASTRAERVYNAMKCRGFKGEFHCLHEFSLSRSDWIWTAAAMIGIALLIIMEVIARI